MLKLHNKFQILLHCNMSTMKQILNPITGRSEWEPQPEHYDYQQEIARAAFADMLHDDERNQKYEAGLRRAVQRVHSQGRRANVLDIGTGTGILSMMAVRCGADTVTACEAFRPMADCAERIMEANGVRAAITLIKKRSTDIVVGAGGDMERRANILVTEVFDTELIGEGAIGIFNHAHEHLLEANCVVVPDRGTMYAQVVESPLCWSWNMPKVVANLDGEVLLNTPAEILRCKGSAALHDVQLNQLPVQHFRTLIAPTAVLQFDFSGRQRIPAEAAVSLPSTVDASGRAHAVFMWWDIDMDQEHEIRLSCAPSWAHPDYARLTAAAQPAVQPPQNAIPWRDHWMQAVYFVPSALHVQRGETVHLNFCHDEYSLWFDVSRARATFAEGGGRQPLCDCGFHNAYSRTRIGQLNDCGRNKKYLGLLERSIDSSSVVLSLSDGSLLGLACAKLGAKSVICLEPHRYSNQVLQKYVATNGLKNVRLADSVEELGDLTAVTHVVAEPSFVSSIVPFDNFYFGTLLAQLRPRLAAGVRVLPHRALTYAVPVEFLDLQKIRAPLGVKEGFDLGIFDRLVEVSVFGCRRPERCGCLMCNLCLGRAHRRRPMPALRRNRCGSILAERWPCRRSCWTSISKRSWRTRRRRSHLRLKCK